MVSLGTFEGGLCGGFHKLGSLLGALYNEDCRFCGTYKGVPIFFNEAHIQASRSPFAFIMRALWYFPKIGEPQYRPQKYYSPCYWDPQKGTLYFGKPPYTSLKKEGSNLVTAHLGMLLCHKKISILGLYWDHGKEDGNYYLGLGFGVIVPLKWNIEIIGKILGKLL